MDIPSSLAPRLISWSISLGVTYISSAVPPNTRLLTTVGMPSATTGKHAVRVHRVNHTRHHLGALHTGVAQHPGGNGRHIRQWSQRPAQLSGNVTGGQHIAVGLRPQRIRSDGGISHPGNQYPGGAIRSSRPSNSWVSCAMGDTR